MGAADPAASAILLGFLLGMQHATDPDHLVAVATIVTGERRLRRGALIGLLWGTGHTVTLMLAGTVIIALNLTVPRQVGVALELLVAVMLVTLGLVRLGELRRELTGADPDHLVADHTHGHAEALHSHALPHRAWSAEHLHVHPSRRLLLALTGANGGWAVRSALVGAVHGLAGSAAVALLVLATMRSSWTAFLYLGVFGFGTVAGMTAFTVTLAYPAFRIGHYARLSRPVAFASALGSIAFGVVYALRAL
jgi:ABC-type nickel/cobalt efflux system permease component RcnA